MVYQRRYFPGAYVTTPMLGTATVTADKIVDEAVTTPKLAEGAVISEKILDETIRSIDIKDGEIKTPDINDGAVTSSKIAPGAVTPDKLSAELAGIVRPLTPPAGTNEIDDEAITTPKIAGEAVTMAKIGPYAVQESRIAPSAVTRAKIADLAINSDKIEAAAIDVTKLKTGSVDGPKIVDGVVSASKLSPNAVTTTKIAPRAVTSDRIALGGVIAENIFEDAVLSTKLDKDALAPRHINRKVGSVVDLSEDFGGHDISNRWTKSGQGNGSGYFLNEKGLNLVTGAVATDYQEIAFAEDWLTPNSYDPILETLISYHDSVVSHEVYFGLGVDEQNYVRFRMFSSPAPTWLAETAREGINTIEDTNIPVTTDPTKLKIDISDPVGGYKFYIDDVLTNTITTTLPGDKKLKPLIRLATPAGGAHQMAVSYLSLIGTRL